LNLPILSKPYTILFAVCVCLFFVSKLPQTAALVVGF